MNAASASSSRIDDITVKAIDMVGLPVSLKQVSDFTVGSSSPMYEPTFLPRTVPVLSATVAAEPTANALVVVLSTKTA